MSLWPQQAAIFYLGSKDIEHRVGYTGEYNLNLKGDKK